MADIDNVTVGENNYNLRDSAAQNALPTQGQVDDIITALNTIANKTDHPYNPANKLPSDYVNDANQTHKFATQAQLTQIETNKNNILLIEQMNGAKNFLNFDADTMKSINTGGTWSGNTWSIDNNVTLTINADKSITLNGTANNGKTIYLAKNLGMTENAYTLSTGALTTKLWAGIIEVGGTENNYTGSTTHVDKTCQPNHITVYIESGCTLSNFTIYPMLTLKSLYDVDSTYVPYALPNTTITPALVECIDKGAKNELSYSLERLKALNTSGTWSGNSYTFRGVTFTYNESTKEISTYGTSTVANAVFHFDTGFIPKSGTTYVLSGCPRNGSASGYRLCNMGVSWANDFGDSATAIGDGTAKDIAIYVASANIDVGTSSNPLVWKPMLCDKALYDVSPQFEPYAMSNVELTEKVERYTAYHTTAFSTANAWTYTDLSFTIPANQIYYFLASVSWSSGQPLEICLSTSATAGGVATSNIIAQSNVQGNIVTCTGQMTADNNNAVTIYCYAKNNSATGSSPTRLTAFRIA